MVRLQQVPLAVAALLAGAALSLCAVLVHGYAWGLLLGVATTVATLVALPPAWWGRLAFALGWVAVLWRATTPRPEGDYLVSADVPGYLLLVFGMGVLATGVVSLARRPPRPDDSGAVGPPP